MTLAVTDQYHFALLAHHIKYQSKQDKTDFKFGALTRSVSLQDCAFHPARRLLAVGLINGGMRVFDCSGAELNQCASWDRHSDSCRSLDYAEQGNVLFSGSADKSLRGFDVESGKAVFRMKNAHDCAIERYILHFNLYSISF